MQELCSNRAERSEIPAGIATQSVKETEETKQAPQPAPTTAATTPAATAAAPPPDAPASISISSNPDAGDIYVDDTFSGNAPATLKLSPGKHMIRVSLTSYKVWSREITVQSGSEMHLVATLEKSNWSLTVTGFVLDVKPGGGETCNCGKTDAAHIDAHIELVLNTTDTAGTQSMVVEVTPRLRAIMGTSGTDWSTKTLRTQFRHQWVKVRGWMTFDTQHAGVAENTNPGGASNWRATAWELHPVTDIQVVTAPH